MNKTAQYILGRLVARVRNRAKKEHGRRWRYVVAEAAGLSMATFNAITQEPPLPVLTMDELFNLAESMDFELQVRITDRGKDVTRDGSIAS